MALLLALASASFIACGPKTIGSVGAVLARDNATSSVRVVETPPGMAAEKAGLAPGDEIIMIDGQYVRDLDLAELRALLRGEVGSDLELTVVRNGQVRHLRVERGALRAPEAKPQESSEKAHR